MRVKNGDIWSAVEPLKQLSEKPLPVKTAMKLMRLLKKIAGEFDPIESCRMQLVQRYGIQDERGVFNVDQNGPEYADFANEFNELMNEDADVDFEPVVIPDEVCESLEVSAAAMMALEKFITIKE